MVVTPLSQERALVHDAGQRFLNNFRSSMGESNDEDGETSEEELRMFMMQSATTTNMGRCQVGTVLLIRNILLC